MTMLGPRYAWTYAVHDHGRRVTGGVMVSYYPGTHLAKRAARDYVARLKPELLMSEHADVVMLERKGFTG